MNTAGLRRRGYNKEEPKDIINTYTIHFDIPSGSMKTVSKAFSHWVVGVEYIIEGTIANNSNDWKILMGTNQQNDNTQLLEGNFKSYSNKIYCRFIITKAIMSEIRVYAYKAGENCYADVTVTEIIHPS